MKLNKHDTLFINKNQKIREKIAEKIGRYDYTKVNLCSEAET